MVEIKNDYYCVKINIHGGALDSIIDLNNNKNLMYGKDERSWNGTDVVIFPFIARLKDSMYMVDNKEYYFKNHGLLRYTDLFIKEKKDDEVTLGFDSNSYSLELYPYLFSFEINYKLTKNKLNITYKITNKDNKKIYYEFGGHPALKVSGHDNDKEFVIEDTKLLFDKDINTTRYNLNDDGSLITNTESYFIPKELNISKDLITKYKTIIVDAKDINNVTLVTNNHKYIFDIKEANVLALWTMEGYGDYLCVEPWWGIPDYINPNRELKDKPLMRSLNVGESEVSGYSIEIF